MTNAYHDHQAARASRDDVCAWMRDRTGATAVDGLAAVLDAESATHNAGRVSGFHENHGAEEWLLPLSAKTPLVWETAPVPENVGDRVAFVLSLGFGAGSPLPQPSGRWNIAVDGRHAVSVRVVTHDQRWRGADGCLLAFAAARVETAPPWSGLTLSDIIRDDAFAAFGPALLTVPTGFVRPGAPARITVTAECHTDSTRWMQVQRANNLLFQTDVYRAADLLVDGHGFRIDGAPVRFGDIHTHSGEWDDAPEKEGCGLGTRRDNYEYARGAGGLDFHAVTDHEHQVRPHTQAAYFALADEYDDPGTFVTIPAFEHTSKDYGHRNVYFRNADGVIVSNSTKWEEGGGLNDPPPRTPGELWAALDAHGTPYMTIPHHPSATSHPLTWDWFDPARDRLVEIYSVWGSSEYVGDFPRGVSDRYEDLGVRPALRRGLRFGLTASADGHDGHPGAAAGPGVKHPHQHHFLGSGRAAVVAPELTRENIFDALFDRRCYATTGAPILLDARVNGRFGGGEAPSDDGRATVTVRCRGSAGVDHVRIMRTDRVAATIPVHGAREAELEWTDPEPCDGACYWVRAVQTDGESAWSSPAWF